ncbi:unnamed protein product [Cyprideis torosa]|uniref:Uncharacterized protein n=1 Tax=Cyprideis torosa TaxID=163714 RepID=A0A7R8WJR0_9CRUS|nr:unnamed protein product [Cyprideis torosa]CAG0900487.1 unnamed protein product [Cyprideis torosa]
MGSSATKEKEVAGQKTVNMEEEKKSIIRRPQYNFASPPPPEFTCSICTELLFDPVEISICDHLFCRPCVTDWLKRSRTCPECRIHITEASLKEPNRSLRNFLANLRVHCPEEFCDDIVTIEQLEEHVKTCSTVRIPCQKGCEQLLLKSERKNHDCLQKLKELLNPLNEKYERIEKTIQEKDTTIKEQELLIKDQAKTISEQEKTIKDLERNVKNQEVLMKLRQTTISNFQESNTRLIQEKKSMVARVIGLNEEQLKLQKQNTDLLQEVNRKEQAMLNLNAEKSKLQEGAANEIQALKEALELEKKKQPERVPKASKFTETDETLEKKSVFSFETRLRYDMGVGVQISSSPFEFQGFSWKIIVGRTKSHLSLFLSSDPTRNYSRNTPKAWKVASFHLRLQREGWTQPRTITQYGEVFTMPSRIKGFQNFCKWNRTRGFEEEIIQVELMIYEVSVPVNPAPFLVRRSRTLPVAFGYRFYDVKQMRIHDEAYSNTFIIEGHPWRLMITKAGGNLEAYLVCAEEKAIPAWTEGCSFSFELRNRKQDATLFEHGTEISLKIGGQLCPWQLVQNDRSIAIDLHCE